MTKSFCRSERVWMTLSGIYGTQFTSAFGDKPSKFWERGLQNFSDEKINLALEKITLGNSPFENYPPNLPQLISFLRSFKSPNEQQALLEKENPPERKITPRMWRKEECQFAWQFLERQMAIDAEKDKNAPLKALNNAQEKRSQ